MNDRLKTESGLRVPDSLKAQLLHYRRRVWTIKVLEAVAIVMLVFGAAFLLIYVGDRWGDTPDLLRMSTLIAALTSTAIIPWYFYRWVYSHRGLEPLARLLGKKLPAVGDQLLGVLELANSDSEQARSPALCQAAMKQVAEDAASRDFTQSTPPCHHRAWATAAGVVALIAASLATMYPAASASALARLMMPWKDTPRYTFTRIAELPSNFIMAHGEPMKFSVDLSDESLWQPDTGKLTVAGQTPLVAQRSGNQYAFVLPPQIKDQMMTLEVGDVTRHFDLKPTLRPELSSVTAAVRLPEYLGQPAVRQIDSRAGSISIVRGGEAIFTATANRELATGEINAEMVAPKGASLKSVTFAVESTPKVQFKWQDKLGLTGREPFDLAINAIDDEPPTLICDGIARQTVVLDTETIKFTVQASDDFGVRRVGMMWRGFAGAAAKPAKGERALAAGGFDAANVDVMGTFSAKALRIEPQPIELFVWAEDYLPGRKRVYSPPHLVYVLTPDQHAIWITEQLSKWHRQALDVRDRERQLYEKNKELRAMSPQELAQADMRREVQRQASAEQSNGRRLGRLGQLGDELVRTAARNPEIGVGHLERWAEMLQVLNDLSENRMPSVADLLTEAADAPTKLVAAPKTKGGPMAGQVRTAKPGAASESPEGPAPKLRSAPQLVDMESSANSPDEEPAAAGPPKKPSSPSLRLPTTTVMGKNKKPGDTPPPNQQDSLQEAVVEQEDLLAEFDKLADELNAVLANLEGSTLVKRLKAASREQNLVAGRLTEQLQPAFGASAINIKPPVREVLDQLKETEQTSTRKVSFIMDDLAAYFERRRFMHFKTVLDEMKSSDVIGGLRSLAEEISTKQGLSIAQAEYWSDAMDRWAENLVDPACSGQCPGGKSPESLPPSIVLEVLQILEAEIDLRDETRVAQQALDAVEPGEHAASAKALSRTQAEINRRIVKVIARIGELQDADKHFGKELAMLGQVDVVMTEASEILVRPETGPPAIAAETEAIELILRSKRINPKGGGGGGSSPGGGGSGNTTDSAIALLGKGTNQKEIRENRGVTQTTGETGTVLPEEFRRGLDQYFNRLGGS